MASTIPNGVQQFLDNNGNPLVGGRVHFYIPGTTTAKDTWQDPDLTILNTNPITLNARGEATVWGNGRYRQVVYDQLGNLIWDRIAQSAGADMDSAATDELKAQLANPEPNNGGSMVRTQYSSQHEIRTVTERLKDYFPSDADIGLVDSGDQSDSLSLGVENSMGILEIRSNKSYMLDQCSLNESFFIYGGHKSKLKTNIPDKGVLWAHSLSPDKITAQIHRLQFTQPTSSTPGGGGANNHSSVKLNGTNASEVVGCRFINASLGIGLHYQYEGDYTDASDRYSLVAFNYFENIEKQAIESFAASHARIIGNAINSDRTNSNTIRLTGYGHDHSFFAPCLGTVAAGNAIRGGTGSASGGAPTAVGVGVQNAVKGVSFAANSIIGTWTGIQCVAGTTLENNAKSNYFQSTLINNNRGVDNYGSENSTFVVNIENYASEGIIERQESRPSRGGNKYSATIKAGSSSVGRPVDFQRNCNSIDVNIDLLDSPANLPASRIYGNGITGRAVANCKLSDTAAIFAIAANDSVLDIVVHGDVASTAQTRVSVTGSRNIVRIRTHGRVVVTGNENHVTTYCNVIRTSGNYNKVTGIYGVTDDVGTGNTFS